MSARPASGGGRWVEVDPARLPRWLAGFTERHGQPSVSSQGDTVRLVGTDECQAILHPPPGVVAPRNLDGTAGLDGMARPDGMDRLDAFAAAAAQPRRLGVLLARQAAVALGIAHGDRLVTSKVHTSYVQGRTAAGGWSQQRFARRRANQAKAAANVAADLVARILLPECGTLDALVTGGDRRTVDAVLADARLAPLAALRADRFVDAGEPRRDALERAVAQARAVRILIRDP